MIIMMIKVPRINRYECAGCGLCTLSLPEVFRLTPEGISEVYGPTNAKPAAVQKVIDDCPVNCVHWFKANN